MVMNKTQYQKYLQSTAWSITRSRRLAVSGNRCEFRPEIGDWGNAKHGPLLGDRCTETKTLEVHHLWYEKAKVASDGSVHWVSILGSEKDRDLEVLCRFHHLVRHSCGFTCETCGDEVDADEEDVIDAVKQAVKEAGGDVRKVKFEDIQEVGSCSYCNR